MDLPRPKGKVDVVVGKDARERLDDTDRLDGGRIYLSGCDRDSGRHRLADGLARVAGDTADDPRFDLLQRWQLARDALGPPVHADLALRARGAGRELVEVRLLELLAGGEDLLAGVVLD